MNVVPLCDTLKLKHYVTLKLKCHIALSALAVRDQQIADLQHDLGYTPRGCGGEKRKRRKNRCPGLPGRPTPTMQSHLSRGRACFMHPMTYPVVILSCTGGGRETQSTASSDRATTLPRDHVAAAGRRCYWRPGNGNGTGSQLTARVLSVPCEALAFWRFSTTHADCNAPTR